MITIHTLPEGTIAQLRSLLADLDHHLIADVSNYARGRQRYWLQHQWDLQKRTFSPGVQAPALWQLLLNICQPHDFVPEIGLIAKGSIGIKPHRDDSYADYRAINIQLGAAHWGYDYQYPGYYWVPNNSLNAPNPQTYEVRECLVMFNCKKPHGAEPLSEDGYSINLWRISKRFRTDFEGYLGGK